MDERAGTALARELAQWGSQRAERLRMADQLHLARPIDHNIVFPTGHQARRAASALRDRGFRVVSHRSTASSRSSFRERDLTATRADAMDEESMRTVLALVVGIAVETGGDYDGFGAPVVTA